MDNAATRLKASDIKALPAGSTFYVHMGVGAPCYLLVDGRQERPVLFRSLYACRDLFTVQKLDSVCVWRRK